jgi:NarL family two-component system response regulator LiaR
MEPIRILIADDHPIVREGLRALIHSAPDLELVGEATNGEEAIEKARLLKPDITLLDLIMPRKDGLTAISEIRRENPEARILVLTSFSEEEKVLPAIKAGALGYLLKDSMPDELFQAIQEVHNGQSSLHPVIARKLIQELSQPSALPPTQNPLTAREMEVLKLVAQGLTNREIAERLAFSEHTVRTNVGHILRKLQLDNRTQAAAYALREGIA